MIAGCKAQNLQHPNTSRGGDFLLCLIESSNRSGDKVTVPVRQNQKHLSERPTKIISPLEIITISVLSTINLIILDKHSLKTTVRRLASPETTLIPLKGPTKGSHPTEWHYTDTRRIMVSDLIKLRVTTGRSLLKWPGLLKFYLLWFSALIFCRDKPNVFLANIPEGPD